MQEEEKEIATATEDQRAGFWRRFISFVIDSLVIYALLQLLVAFLFFATDGVVQMRAGLNFLACSLTQGPLPQLSPPPPRDSNVALSCKVSFFGLQTAQTLTVGRGEKVGGITKIIGPTYFLTKKGHAAPIPMDDYALGVFIACLIVSTWLTGRTLGDRVVRIAMIEIAKPTQRDVSLGRVTAHYLAIYLGILPLAAVWILAIWMSGGNMDTLSALTNTFFFQFLIASILAIGWGVLLLVQITNKEDPVYDRLAGTAVVRRPPGANHVATAP